MDDVLSLVQSLVWFGLSAGGGVWSVYVYFAAARKEETAKLNKRIDDLADELEQHRKDGIASRADLRERMVQVEAWLKDMPDKETVHQLALAVSDMRGDVKALTESLKSVAHSTRRTEEFLLAKGHM
jgi:ribosomal protein S15P/S13E